MMRRSCVMLPLLIVGAFLYWSAALSLGSLSITLLTPDPELELVPAHETGDGIVVRLVDEDDIPSLTALPSTNDSEEPRDPIGRTAY